MPHWKDGKYLRPIHRLSQPSEIPFSKLNEMTKKKYCQILNDAVHFSSTFGTGGGARYDAHASNGIDDVTRAQALAEEEAAMNQYKVRLFFYT